MQLKGKYQGKINYKESQEEAPKEGFAIGIALRDNFPTS
jgi:hypothetical protein